MQLLDSYFCTSVEPWRIPHSTLHHMTCICCPVKCGRKLSQIAKEVQTHNGAFFETLLIPNSITFTGSTCLVSLLRSTKSLDALGCCEGQKEENKSGVSCSPPPSCNRVPFIASSIVGHYGGQQCEIYNLTPLDSTVSSS